MNDPISPGVAICSTICARVPRAHKTHTKRARPRKTVNGALDSALTPIEASASRRPLIDAPSRNSSTGWRPLRVWLSSCYFRPLDFKFATSALDAARANSGRRGGKRAPQKSRTQTSTRVNICTARWTRSIGNINSLGRSKCSTRRLSNASTDRKSPTNSIYGSKQRHQNNASQ